MIEHVRMKLGDTEIAISNEDQNAAMEKAISVLEEAGFVRIGKKYAAVGGPYDVYNGWTNYETWDVALWFGNDDGIYKLTRAIVANAPGRAGAADALRELVEEGDPCQDRADYYADIMSHALRGRVDWFKIADSIAEDLGREW